LMKVKQDIKDIINGNTKGRQTTKDNI
jgi:hypothetical protein